MSKKRNNPPNPWENKPLSVNLYKQLIFLKENLRKVHENKQTYFHEKQNQIDINHYYQSVISLDSRGIELFYIYTHLLDRTHKNRNPYFISKDLYLYNWVDLYPDGTVRCIYSGEAKDPRALILQDYEIIVQKREEYKYSHERIEQRDYELLKQLKYFERSLKLNTEHIVPKSWFGGLEPMKGDLHHLFICDPKCNIARSNFAFVHFTDIKQESPDETLQTQCGAVINRGFEPRFGKGAIARAMLYFFLRYPRVIKKTYRSAIDSNLLIRWHLEYPVTLYERHRNQAIYQIQGNRNPFIDFPNLVEKIEFPN